MSLQIASDGYHSPSDGILSEGEVPKKKLRMAAKEHARSSSCISSEEDSRERAAEDLSVKNGKQSSEFASGQASPGQFQSFGDPDTRSNSDDDVPMYRTGASGRLEYIPARKQREFIPENKKDIQYWEKRRKNNEAARRSREKRRMHDLTLENRIIDLTKENYQLKTELITIKRKYGLPLDEPVTPGSNDSMIRHEAAPSVHQSATSNHSHSVPMAKQAPATLGSAHRDPATPQQLYTMGRGVPMSLPIPPMVQSAAKNVGMPVFMSPLTTSSSQFYTPSITEHPHLAKSTASTTPPSAALVGAPLAPDQKVLKDEAIDSSTSRTDFGTTQASTKKASAFHSSTEEDRLREQVNLSQVPPLTRISSHYDDSSNESGDSTEREDSRPLELTLKRDIDSPTSSDASARNLEYPPPEGPTPKSPYSMALPHKLRHKISSQESASRPATGLQYFGHYTNGLAQLSEIALAHASPLSLVKPSMDNSLDASFFDRRMETDPGSDPSESVDPKHLDPKYLERRRRNNEAARKCRENRKALTRLREAKSTILETENGKLRNELTILQEEMKQLKELVEKRRIEQQKKEKMDEN